MLKWTLSGLLAILLCSSCDRTPESADPAKPVQVSLQLNWKPEPQFGGFYTAEVERIYEQHGLEVKVIAGGAGAPTVEMVGAGTVPFAIVSADEIVRARAHGNKVVGLFAVYQTNPQAIMTRASRQFESLADVFANPGMLAIERGLPYSDFLERKYGFDQLKIVPSPFGDLSLYRSEEAYAMQCFVTSEPLSAAKIGIEPRTFLIAESGYNPYTTVLATSERYLLDNPATVKAMVDSVRAGWQSYLMDPNRTNDYMGQINSTMDAQTFRDSAAAQLGLIENDATRVAGIGSMTVDRWQVLIDQLVDLKVIDGPMDPRAMFRDMATADSSR
jgi:NitT/TauT family transport system substrate-binding protein